MKRTEARLNRKKSLSTIIKTALTIEQLLAEEREINFKIISIRGDIPLSSLYGNPLAKRLIEKFKD